MYWNASMVCTLLKAVSVCTIVSAVCVFPLVVNLGIMFVLGSLVCGRNFII